MTRAVYIDATEQGERLLHEIGVPAGVRVHKGDPAHPETGNPHSCYHYTD